MRGTRSSVRRFGLAWGLAWVVLWGCQQGSPSSVSASSGVGVVALDETTTAVAALSGATHAGSETFEAAEIVIDVGPNGALLTGRPLEPGLDGPRLLSLRQVGATSLPVDGLEVEDARFVDDGRAVIAITRRNELVRIDARGSARLDGPAFGPLSIDTARRFAAWTTGEMPSFEVVVFDLERGQRVLETTALAPCSSPAVAEDGSVVFVSGATGWVELWSMTSSGLARQLTDRQHGDATPIPTGPGAPLLVGSLLVFENHGSILGFDLERGELEPLRWTRMPLPLNATAALVESPRGYWEVRSLADLLGTPTGVQP